MEIMALFAEIQAAGNTVIIVTHEQEIAACTNEVIRLRDGKLDLG
jgi:putative ABC transport system ATP-binding protein